MTFDKRWFIWGALLGIVFSVTVWAVTVDQIWQNIYDSGNQALRVNQVAG